MPMHSTNWKVDKWCFYLTWMCLLVLEVKILQQPLKATQNILRDTTNRSHAYIKLAGYQCVRERVYIRIFWQLQENGIENEYFGRFCYTIVDLSECNAHILNQLNKTIFHYFFKIIIETEWISSQLWQNLLVVASDYNFCLHGLKQIPVYEIVNFTIRRLKRRQKRMNLLCSCCLTLTQFN